MSWDDVGGLADVREAVTETFELPTQYAELFARVPLKLRSGMLLYGPPGMSNVPRSSLFVRRTAFALVQAAAKRSWQVSLALSVDSTSSPSRAL